MVTALDSSGTPIAGHKGAAILQRRLVLNWSSTLILLALVCSPNITKHSLADESPGKPAVYNLEIATTKQTLAQHFKSLVEIYAKSNDIAVDSEKDGQLGMIVVAANNLIVGGRFNPQALGDYASDYSRFLIAFDYGDGFCEIKNFSLSVGAKKLPRTLVVMNTSDTSKEFQLRCALLGFLDSLGVKAASMEEFAQLQLSSLISKLFSTSLHEEKIQ